ncbi:MAG: response regulator transcription factor [Thermicanus sp.]|nr:response regulator transcription factor [Thermicanus sp.]
MVKKILAVDDESSILTLLKFNLEKAGFEVVTTEDGWEAISLIQTEKPDLVLLDLMLPSIDGMEILKKIRQEKNNVPVVMLTARGEDLERILGLELGADDYITKPFLIREVVARVKAILRRTISNVYSEEEETIQIGDLLIHTERYEVYLKGVPIELTPKEFELLLYLAKNRGRVLTREQLLNKVWNYDFMGDSRIVDVHISHLREKIEEDPKQPRHIRTVRGLGYKFEDRNEEQSL